ncbi:hypothetical protein BH11ARM2_BH11ARM2_39400 [soil metagenome]
MAEWYYIGHYGQLGPLTREQIDELVQGGVIARDTYVWRSGLADWQPADRVPELQEAFKAAEPFAPPPPPPGSSRPPTVAPPGPSLSPNFSYASPEPNLAATYGYGTPVVPMAYQTVRSDRSRALGGILQLIIPGAGRIYLGYAAIGILQLILAICGVGWIWSFIDGIVMLTGGVKMDGYGRHLTE